MNRLHSAKLDTEHLVNGEPEPLVWLRNAGYPTNEVEQHRVVSEKDDDENKAYDVHEIETYSKPPELADAVEDSATVYVCHCGDFYHRHVPGLEEQTPADMGRCKHIKDIDKSLKAIDDDSQMTL